MQPRQDDPDLGRAVRSEPMLPTETAGDWIALPEEKGGANRGTLRNFVGFYPIVFSQGSFCPLKTLFMENRPRESRCWIGHLGDGGWRVRIFAHGIGEVAAERFHHAS